MKHNGDDIELSVRYPEIKVFKSSEKQGINLISLFVIDDKNLGTKQTEVSC